ncbi:MAG: hypothetical protein LBC92_04275 [Rickettsiales bacterium]|jgi:hypothetical protein|nr:hypothetical protein [Rickettsiales bacterium]
MVDGLRDCIMCCELYAYIAEAIRKETIRCIESYFKHNEGRIIGTVNDITVTVNCDGSCDGCMSFSSDFIKNNADRIYKGKIISKKFFDHINYNVKKVIGRELENVSPIISPHSSNTLCLLIEKGEEERITSNEAALYSLRQQSEIIVKSANHVDECEEIKKCEKPAINKPINITKNNQNKDSSEEGSKCGDLGKEEELKQQVKVSNLHKTKDYSSVISELTERVKTLNREYDNELSQVESLEKRTKEEVVKNSNKQPILQLSSE